MCIVSVYKNNNQMCAQHDALHTICVDKLNDSHAARLRTVAQTFIHLNTPLLHKSFMFLIVACSHNILDGARIKISLTFRGRTF